MSEKIKVLFKAPFADFSGYATVARNLLLELYKNHSDKFDLYLERIVWINSGNLELPEEDLKILNELQNKKYDPKDTTLIHFSIATEFFGEQKVFNKSIGFTMIETDRTANGWAWKCNQMDAIFVPSTFCLSAFMQSNIIKPINVVPFGIDFDKYKPEGEKLIENLPTKFNFLCVGQWLNSGDRKNIGATIQTFLSLFKGNSDVGLILKTYFQGAGTVDKFQLDDEIQKIRQSMGIGPEDGPQIYLVHGAVSEENMIKLYRNADCFILPTCGEAWGMPLLEAATMGVPIITTGGTGADSFLNPEYSILLDAEWKPIGQLPIGQLMYWPNVYEPHQRLAQPNMEEFSRMLHRAYKHSDIIKEKAEEQRKEILERDFSWKSAANTLAETLVRLHA